MLDDITCTLAPMAPRRSCSRLPRLQLVRSLLPLPFHHCLNISRLDPTAAELTAGAPGVTGTVSSNADVLYVFNSSSNLSVITVSFILFIIFLILSFFQFTLTPAATNTVPVEIDVLPAILSDPRCPSPLLQTCTINFPYNAGTCQTQFTPDCVLTGQPFYVRVRALQNSLSQGYTLAVDNTRP